MNIIPKAIEDYAASHSTPESALFKALVRRTLQDTQIPQMQVGHLEGRFLNMLVKIVRAKTILEIGTFTGYSALAMAEALPANGRLFTCDIDPAATSIAQEYWKKSPHGRKIRLLLGSALRTIPKIKPRFDIIFIDADKPNYTHYWELCLPKLRRGGLIVVDNVLWSGHVLDPKEATDRAIASFNHHVSRDPRVEVVMLTVRDGITLAYKK